MIPGTPVMLGTKQYIVPPLNFKALQKHKDFLVQAFRGEIDPVQFMESGDMDKFVDIVHSAVRRNYPDVTAEEIAEHLDIGNLQPTLDAIMKTSGFVSTLPGEPAPGNSQT